MIQKKKAKETIIVHIAVPGDSNVMLKKTEKYGKYQDQERLKELEIKDKSGASCSRCIGFSVKETGRPLVATRN